MTPEFKYQGRMTRRVALALKRYWEARGHSVQLDAQHRGTVNVWLKNTEDKMTDTLEQFEERLWTRLKDRLPPSKTLQVEHRADPVENLRRARKALGMPEEA